MAGEINYNQLVERALLNVVRDSIHHAAEVGMSGQQHFYVTFKTHFAGVSIPNHLMERYKDEMTIVLQHQYWDLIINIKPAAPVTNIFLPDKFILSRFF